MCGMCLVGEVVMVDPGTCKRAVTFLTLLLSPGSRISRESCRCQ